MASDRVVGKQHIQCCLQEIVKLKVLELHVLFSEQLLTIVGTGRSDRSDFLHRIVFLAVQATSAPQTHMEKYV